MNRRVLVTGGCGFIGSHVVDALIAAGAEVEVLDDLSKGKLSNLASDVPVHVVDITEQASERIVRERQFDAIVHCAAQTNVVRSIAEPALDRRINIDGLRRVMNGAAVGGASAFVFVSSGGAIYGETTVPATEEAPPAPRSPYGWHKLAGEQLIAAAPMRTVSLRLSNVYGPRQRSDIEGGVMSIFAERLASGRPLEIYGDGDQSRDFVHVADVVSAISLALYESSMSGIWNVGTGVATSVNELARMMIAVHETRSSVTHLAARGEVMRSCLDVSKLLATGRWCPRRPLTAGVHQLLEAQRRPRHSHPTVLFRRV